MLAHLLSWIARLAYGAHTSRIARVAYLATLSVSIGLIALAQPDDSRLDRTIYDPGPKVSVVSSYGRYVRLTGALDLGNAYQTEMSIGPITLRGSRFIPFLVPGVAYDLYLIDQGLPAPNPDGTYTVVGQFVAGAGQQPNLYFEPGLPPALTQQNTLARAGIVAASVLLVLGIVSRLIRDADYALSTSGQGASEALTNGPDWLWSGSLGAAYGNAIVRQAPVVVVAHKQPPQVQFVSADHPDAWAVIVNQLQRVQPAFIASAFGPRPGARIHFVDERGLARRGVLVARSIAARDELLADLRALQPNTR